MKKNIKFIRNILISLMALELVAIIINFTPGYQRDKYNNITNLVIGEENVSEFLTYQLYVINKEDVYISQKDTEELITKENKAENYNETITIGDIIYIPIENIATEFNLETKYIQDSNTLIIDNNNVLLKKAKIANNTSLKFKPRELSKTVIEVAEGEEVIYFDTLIRNWRLVRTSLGKIGYVEENKLIMEGK